VSERGSITLWLLGLGLVLMVLGGISVDLWRGISERSALYHAASAAAVAGASGIDEDLWRASGILRLEPETAEDLAAVSLISQPRWEELSRHEVTVEDLTIEVTLERPLRLTLLRLLGLDEIVVRARAQAQPRFVP